VRRRQLPGTFLLCALALVAGQLWAHDVVFPVAPSGFHLHAAGPLWRALAAVPDLGWLAPALAAALVAAMRRPRRALAVLLAVLVVAFAFEGARRAADLTPHSIHARDRASDPAGAPVVALFVESSAPAAPAPVPVGEVVGWAAAMAASASPAPAASRAPPSARA